MVPFPVSYLNAGELLTVGESFLPILGSVPPQSDTLTPLLKQALRNDVNDLSSVLLRSQSSVFTKQLSDLDDIFDSSFQTFKNFCIVMSKQDADQEVARLAEKIVTAINNVNSQMYDSGYAQELAEARVLTDELNKQEFQAAIAACNAAPWYTGFHTAYLNLRNKYDEKISTEAQQEAMSLKPVKVAIRRHLGAVYAHMENLLEFMPETFSGHAAKIEEAVKVILPAVRARNTRNAESLQEQPDAAAVN